MSANGESGPSSRSVAAEISASMIWPGADFRKPFTTKYKDNDKYVSILSSHAVATMYVGLKNTIKSKLIVHNMYYARQIYFLFLDGNGPQPDWIVSTRWYHYLY
jgi:hypothetical protein